MDNKLLTIRAAENVVRILPPLNVKIRAQFSIENNKKFVLIIK